MLKLAVKILIFAMLFFLGLSFTDDFFKERRISKFSRDAYKKLDKNVDIAIFGSSHGLNGIDPRLLQKEMNKTTFNFCSGGQRLVSTMPVIDEVLSDNEVELAIVDIFYGTTRELRVSEKRTKFFQYNTLDNLDISISKWQAHREIYGAGEEHNMFPTLRRHQKWPEVIRNEEYVPDISSDINNGFFTRFFFKEEPWDKSMTRANKNKVRDVIITALNDDEKSNIDQVIAKFESYNVPVLFVSTPFFLDSLGPRSRSHQELIMEYIREKNAKLLDFNELWGNELQFEQEDFIDVGHLNTKGALKVSSYLTDYIKENYEFNDNTIEGRDLLSNRYSIIDNDSDDILLKKEFDSLSDVGKHGIAKLYLYEAYDGMYEILFEGFGADFKEMILKYEYRYSPEEENKITKYQSRFINEKGVVGARRKFNHNIHYKGKEYQVFQFKTVFDRLINFKLFLISGKERIEILKFDELKLNNGNR